MSKKYVSYSIDTEVIKQVKIKMANLEMNNQSLLVENLLKQWISQSK